MRVTLAILVASALLLAAAPGAAQSLTQAEALALQDRSNAHFKRGEFAEAERLKRQVLQYFIDVLGAEHPDVASPLHDLGRITARAGKYKEAESFLRRALALREKDAGPGHAEVAVILGDLAGLFVKQKRYKDAEPLLRRALALADKALPPSDPAFAFLLDNLGMTLAALGRPAEAEAPYRRSLAFAEKYLAADDVLAGTLRLAKNLQEQRRLDDAELVYERVFAMVGRDQEATREAVQLQLELARDYAEQRRYQDSERHYRRVLATVEKQLGADHSATAPVLKLLADVVRWQQRPPDAEGLYRRALAVYEKNGDQDGIAGTVHGIGLIYGDLGRFREAEPLFRRALAIAEARKGLEDLEVAEIVDSLATLYAHQGRQPEAEPLFRRALVIREKKLGAADLLVAESLNNIANIHYGFERWDDAERAFRRALAIKEKKLGRDDPFVASTLMNLGNLLFVRNRGAEAEASYRRALSIKERALGPDHPDVARILGPLAFYYRMTARLDEAEQYFRRTLAIREKTVGTGHPDYLRSLLSFADLLALKGKHDESLRAIRTAASIYRARTLAAADRRDAGTELEFADSGLMLHAVLADRESDRVRRAVLAAEAFETAQLAGRQAAGGAIAQMAARFAAGSDRLAASARQRQDAVERRLTLDKAMVAAVAEPPSRRNVAREEAIRRETASLDGQLERLDAEIARDFPAYAEIANPAPVALAEAQKLLGEREALLVYQSGSSLLSVQASFVWIVRRDRTELIRLPLAGKDIAEKVAALRAQLDPDVVDLKALPPVDPAQAHALYLGVLAPAAPLLADMRLLYIVADAALQSLPFAVLVTDKPASADDPAPNWLIRKHALAVLPSVSALKALRAFAKPASSAREPFAGFGDPLLQGRPGDRKGTKGTASLYRGATADVAAVRALDRLEETAGELQAMGKALNARPDAIWLREAATEARAKRTDLSKYRILAFATHGLMAGEFRNYGEPALVLTPPRQASAEDDGLLGASEIAQLKLDADWVILSACNTAAADGTPGAEGLSGLAKAFFYAGARSLLVSHWKVESESSARLTTGAITALAREPSIGRAEAFRRSMLALMAERGFAHPLFWAPFVLVGEGSAGG